MKTTAFSKLFKTVRGKDYQQAHELFKGIMEQKVADRLAEVRKTSLHEQEPKKALEESR